MRIVILSSSVYSESACAMAVRMAELRHVPVGALALSTLDRGTLQRKLGQWGVREVARYARTKLIPHRSDEKPQLRNPYLEPVLKHQGGVFRSLREVAAVHGFAIAVCNDQNAPDSIARLKAWSPDLDHFHRRQHFAKAIAGSTSSRSSQRALGLAAGNPGHE